jgi:dUTP pyrophosphatase
MDVRAYFAMDFLAKLDHERMMYPCQCPVDVVNMSERFVNLMAGRRMLIPTGIKTAISDGYEIQVRPRSGLALKNGITVLNTPGTIDSGYRKGYGIILMNMGSEPFCITHGDRVAQLVLMAVPKIKWEVVQTVDASDREGGFGHTGVT